MRLPRINGLDLRPAVLIHAMRRAGVKRKTVRLRPIKPALKDKRQLRAIINGMVEAVFAHVPALIEATKNGAKPRSHFDSGGSIVNPATLVIIGDSLDDIDRLLSLIVTQTQNVMTRLQVELRGWGSSVERNQRTAFAASLFSATRVDMSTLLSPHAVERTVEHYLTWSTSLIRDVGAEAQKRIAGAVLQAIREETPPRELAKQIREFEDMSYRRALNIASDQTTKLSAALDRARQEEVGITAFTWIHSGSPHPRDWHLDRDGEVFPWDTDEIDTGDFPGEPPFCGCIAQATIVDDGSADQSAEGDLPPDVDVEE
jgi:SPP1 gp7 family putative phage head morphogenesis protein